MPDDILSERLRNLGSAVFSIETVFVLLLSYDVYVSARYFNGALEASHLNYVLMAMLSLYILVYLFRNPISDTTLLVLGLFSVFVLFYSATFLWGSGGEYAQWKVIRLLTVIPLLFVGAVLVFSHAPARVHRFFVLFGTAALALSLAVFHSRYVLEQPPHWQLNANYILISRVLGVGVLVWLYLYVRSNDWGSKLISAAASTVIFVAMLHTGSRGPLLALIGGVAVFVGWLLLRDVGGSTTPRVVANTIVGGAGAGVFVWHFRESRTVERLAHLLSWSDNESTTHRVDYLLRSTEYWRESPLLGHGVGEFPILYLGADERYYPHNVLFELAVEAGLLGVALFVGTVVVILVVSLTSHSEAPALQGLALAVFLYVLANAMVTGDISTNRIVFVSLGTLLLADGDPARGAVTERLHSVISRQ